MRVTWSGVGMDIEASGFRRALYSGLQEENEEDACGWVAGGGLNPQPQVLSEALGQVLCGRGTLYFLLSEWNSAFRWLRTWTLTGIRLRPQNTVLEACVAARGPWRSQWLVLGPRMRSSLAHYGFQRSLRCPAFAPEPSPPHLARAPAPGAATLWLTVGYRAAHEPRGLRDTWYEPSSFGGAWESGLPAQGTTCFPGRASTACLCGCPRSREIRLPLGVRSRPQV